MPKVERVWSSTSTLVSVTCDGDFLPGLDEGCMSYRAPTTAAIDKAEAHARFMVGHRAWPAGRYAFIAGAHTRRVDLGQ
jgi:hypothetical protein